MSLTENVSEGHPDVVDWQEWLPEEPEPAVPPGLRAGPWFPFKVFQVTDRDNVMSYVVCRRRALRLMDDATDTQTSAKEQPAQGCVSRAEYDALVERVRELEAYVRELGAWKTKAEKTLVMVRTFGPT